LWLFINFEDEARSKKQASKIVDVVDVIVAGVAARCQ
jgi:hypothetical protein